MNPEEPSGQRESRDSSLKSESAGPSGAGQLPAPASHPAPACGARTFPQRSLWGWPALCWAGDMVASGSQASAGQVGFVREKSVSFH